VGVTNRRFPHDFDEILSSQINCEAEILSFEATVCSEDTEFVFIIEKAVELANGVCVGEIALKRNKDSSPLMKAKKAGEKCIIC
jgi:hypothetical protein